MTKRSQVLLPQNKNKRVPRFPGQFPLCWADGLRDVDLRPEQMEAAPSLSESGRPWCERRAGASAWTWVPPGRAAGPPGARPLRSQPAALGVHGHGPMPPSLDARGRTCLPPPLAPRARRAPPTRGPRSARPLATEHMPAEHGRPLAETLRQTCSTVCSRQHVQEFHVSRLL